MQRFSLALLALSLVACADQTALLVEVSSPDLVIPRDIDSLTIRARTPTGAMFDETFAVDMGWPHSLTILPADAADQGQVIVEVTGSRAGVFVVRRVALTAFQRGVTRHVDVVLSAACVDVVCGADVDCVAGECVGAEGTPDAGVDASMVDTGIDMDAWTPDDGGIDSSIDVGDTGVDAGIDVGTIDAGRIDSGIDAGRDAGSPDTGVDAATPIDSGTLGCTGAACLGAVVISEVTSTGPMGATDEFVELYNRSGGTATLDGCRIIYHSASGATPTTRGTLGGVSIPSHRYYLAASGSYAGSPAADFVWTGTSGAADAGGHMTLDCGGTTIDRIGWGTAAMAEGAPVTPTATGSASYERKANVASTPTSMSAGGADVTAGNGEDTGHNDRDVLVRATRDPQSSASPAEP